MIAMRSVSHAPTRQRRPRSALTRLVPCLLLMALLGLAAAGCTAGRSQGSYPIDIFTEMHYSQSVRAQEPPRLAPPEGAVPVTGRELAYEPDQYKALANPVPRDAKVLQQANRLFQVNCAPCHGAQGKGDGPTTTQFLIEKYKYTPIVTLDLTSAQVQNLTDGEIFSFITNGLVVMPAWKKLLTEQERWMLVHAIRSLASQ
ncbi:MAG: cytochrome c [Chloroflexi bacterium]|nr:cytochrome c [Chloroflexota bacterium]